jgi:hypothetical protein
MAIFMATRVRKDKTRQMRAKAAAGSTPGRRTSLEKLKIRRARRMAS